MVAESLICKIKHDSPVIKQRQLFVIKKSSPAKKESMTTNKDWLSGNLFEENQLHYDFLDWKKMLLLK